MRRVFNTGWRRLVLRGGHCVLLPAPDWPRTGYYLQHASYAAVLSVRMPWQEPSAPYLRAMISPLSISPAVAADIPEMVALVNSAYRGDSSRQGWTTEAHLLDGQRTDADDLHDLLTAPGATFLLARQSVTGQLLGSVYLKAQAPDLYLGMLSVSPAHQAYGIGKQLMAAAEAHARALDHSGLLISVISVRHELLAWYERHGFRRTGETIDFPRDTRFGIPKQELELLLLRKQLVAK